jgi:glutamate racemase
LSFVNLLIVYIIMIGVFDSGVGGLSVVKEIFKSLPNRQIIYFGDAARLPYGTKGVGFVKKYSEKITRWLLDRDAKIIIVACHTASALAGDYLKEEFKNVPIFDMITPTANKIASFGFKRIGIVGTPGTIKSNAWENHLIKLNPKLKIYSLACPLFVPLVEEGWVDKKATREIVKEYLSCFKDKKIDGLVLACTHYSMLEGVIKTVLGKKVEIIDPAKILANEISQFLSNNGNIKIKAEESQFFFSDEPYNLKKICHLCFNKKIESTIVDPF